IVDTDPGHGAPELFYGDGRGWGRGFCGGVNDHVGGVGVGGLWEVLFSRVFFAWRERRCPHSLYLFMTDGGDHVCQMRALISERFKDALAFSDGTVITNEDGHDALSLRRGRKGHEGAELIWARAGELVIKFDGLDRLVEPVSQNTAKHWPHRVKLEFE